MLYKEVDEKKVTECLKVPFEVVILYYFNLIFHNRSETSYASEYFSFQKKKHASSSKND